MILRTKLLPKAELRPFFNSLLEKGVMKSRKGESRYSLIGFPDPFFEGSRGFFKLNEGSEVKLLGSATKPSEARFAVLEKLIGEIEGNLRLFNCLFYWSGKPAAPGDKTDLSFSFGKNRRGYLLRLFVGEASAGRHHTEERIRIFNSFLERLNISSVNCGSNGRGAIELRYKNKNYFQDAEEKLFPEAPDVAKFDVNQASPDKSDFREINIFKKSGAGFGSVLDKLAAVYGKENVYTNKVSLVFQNANWETIAPKAYGLDSWEKWDVDLFIDLNGPAERLAEDLWNRSTPANLNAFYVAVNGREYEVGAAVKEDGGLLYVREPLGEAYDPRQVREFLVKNAKGPAPEFITEASNAH